MEYEDLYIDDLPDRLNELYSSSFDEFDEDFLEHFGVGHDEDPPGRGSGRFAFGSGEHALQRAWDFDSEYKKFKAQGMTEVEIALSMGYYKIDKYTKKPLLDENGQYIGNTTSFKVAKQIASETIKAANYAKVREMVEAYEARGEKVNISEIARQLGVNESTVRGWRDKAESDFRTKTKVAEDKLIKRLEDGVYVDVGKGAEVSLGISSNALKVTIERLKQDGYSVQEIKVNQLTQMGQKTTMLVLAPPGMTAKEIFMNKDNIKPYSENEVSLDDATRTGLGVWQPQSVDSSRVKIKYSEEGGTDRDGLIEIRAIRNKDGTITPACEDLSLGNAKYAQVRIAVDGKYYIKGMAVYNTDLPEGMDIRVNSNKSVEKGLEGALKELKVNSDGTLKDNPFGATVIQRKYIGSDGKEHLSSINIVGYDAGNGDIRDEHKDGVWATWSKSLPSQFLAKQPLPLVKEQLNEAKNERQEELNDILKLTNPTVKKQMLLDFAESCDGAAKDLKGAPLKGQATKVLLPIPTQNDSECYCPTLENGTVVALVRFPHTGSWEIPVCTVNNNNKEAKSIMNDAQDAIGITPKTASTLSGADFDGDTCLVIPISKKTKDGQVSTLNLKTSANGIKLPDLEGFDPTASWGRSAFPEGTKYKCLTKKQTQTEMGVSSNLITDMIAGGCQDVNELTRAVKYSMVVIDSNKHDLNYKAAAEYYGIQELRQKYQDHGDGTYGGASTILSKAKGDERVDERKLARTDKEAGVKEGIDVKTGELVYVKTGRTYEEEKKVRLRDENGKLVKDADGKQLYETRANGKPLYEKTGVTKVATQKITKMDATNDARTLVRDKNNQVEMAYAEYANAMKAMANKARLEYLATPSLKYNPEAKKKYATEVESLTKKLQVAKSNAQYERYAQNMANARYQEILLSNPKTEDSEKKRLKSQCLSQARRIAGASKNRVTFTDKEWEAIQAGAVSETTLKQLLKNADKESYTQLATPRKENKLSNATKAAIKAAYINGNSGNFSVSQEDIAEEFGVSISTVSEIVNAA